MEDVTPDNLRARVERVSVRIEKKISQSVVNEAILPFLNALWHARMMTQNQVSMVSVFLANDMSPICSKGYTAHNILFFSLLSYANTCLSAWPDR